MTALSCVGNNDLNRLANICKHAKSKHYDLEEVDGYGNTALLKACFLERLEAVKMLLNCGANIKAINYLGQNALTLATYSGSALVVSELLNHRSLSDFNLSSVFPAYCVAVLRKDMKLMNMLWEIDSRSCSSAATSHGLYAQDIGEMVKRCQSRKSR